MHVDVWGADVPISMSEPAPYDRPIMVDWGGFAMTTGGVVHRVSAEDIEELFTPFFSPQRNVDPPEARL